MGLKTNYRLMQVKVLQNAPTGILLTLFKLAFVIKMFILSIFEWPFYTGFTVYLFSWNQFSTLQSIFDLA